MSAVVDATPLGARSIEQVAGGGMDRLVRFLWVAPLVFALVVMTLYPTVFLVALALSKSTLGKPFSAFVGLTQILRVLGDPQFQLAVARSVLFAVIVSALQLALGFAIALLFSRLLKAGRFLVSLVLLPLMTPPVAVGVAWKLILAPAGGLLNGILADLGVLDAPLSFLASPYLAWVSLILADVWQWTPFVVILCFAALMTIPESVNEAASIDGASRGQRLWHVTLPLVAAPLSAVFLLKLIIAFKLFDLVYVLTFGGPGFATTTAGFSIWRTALERFDVGGAAAQTLIFSIVIGLVTLPVVRFHKAMEARER